MAVDPKHERPEVGPAVIVEILGEILAERVEQMKPQAHKSILARVGDALCPSDLTVAVSRTAWRFALVEQIALLHERLDEITNIDAVTWLRNRTGRSESKTAGDWTY